MNVMLPYQTQIQILPQVGYEDGFFALTERQLVGCLLKDFQTNRRGKQLQPKKKKIRLSDIEEDRQRSLARILSDVFGSKVSALQNTQDEVG